MTLTRVIATAGILLCVGTGAIAQSQQEFVEALSGNWFVFDPAHSASAGRCQLELEAAQGDVLEANPANCRSPLATVRSWGIDGNTLALRDEAGSVIARLGGNQIRITGELAQTDQGIILERAEGDQFAYVFAQLIQRHPCIYRGTSSACASPTDLSVPQIDAAEGTGNIRLLAKLFVRSQPRRDSPSIGVLASGACIEVNQCTIASDGVWCRAKFDEVNAWVAKSALRQGEWPVTTYVAGCDAAAPVQSRAELNP